MDRSRCIIDENIYVLGLISESESAVLFLEVIYLSHLETHTYTRS